MRFVECETCEGNATLLPSRGELKRLQSIISMNFKASKVRPQLCLRSLGPSFLHVLQSRESEIETIQMMLREDPETQLRIHVDDSIRLRELPLDELQKSRLPSSCEYYQYTSSEERSD